MILKDTVAQSMDDLEWYYGYSDGRGCAITVEGTNQEAGLASCTSGTDSSCSDMQDGLTWNMVLSGELSAPAYGTYRLTNKVMDASYNNEAYQYWRIKWTANTNAHGPLVTWAKVVPLVTFSTSNMPVEVTALGSDNSAISAGGQHTVYLKSDGRVFASGFNGEGQLGTESYTDSSTPVHVTSLVNIQAIGAGTDFTLYLRADGRVFATGRNQYGQLGDGTNDGRNAPVEITSLGSDNAKLSAGTEHSMFL